MLKFSLSLIDQYLYIGDKLIRDGEITKCLNGRMITIVALKG